MNYQDEILTWLVSNKLTVSGIINEISVEAKIMLAEDPEFYEDITEQYENRVKNLVAEEISRQLGFSIDIIYEILEEPEVQEYLIDDSLYFDVSSNESF